METLEIKILLMRSGINQTDIAKKLGVTRAFVNQIVLGMRSTAYVRKAIAKAVKRPVEELWPSYAARASEGKPKENYKRKAA